MKFNQARKIALSFPDVIEAPHFKMTSFRINGKIFATAPPDELILHVFIKDEDREPVIAMNPECVEKLFWGDKVVGVKINLAMAKTALVKKLLQLAWINKSGSKSLK